MFGLSKWEQSLVALDRHDNVVDLDVGTITNQLKMDLDLSEPTTIDPTIYTECQDLEDMRAWLISLERAGLSKWKGYERAQDMLGVFLGIDIRNQLNYLMTRHR